MLLYIVKPGDSLYSIARAYNISIDKIISENNLKNPSTLVIGQCLIIKHTNPLHIVKAGDTLYNIAMAYNMTVNELLKLNPQITAPYMLNVGDEINIGNGKKRKNIKVNGYAYDSSDLKLVQQSLKYLTYLSIFSYRIDDSGHLLGIDDDALINLALKHNVAPVMVITNIDKNGSFKSDLANLILSQEDVQTTYLNEVFTTFQKKGYRGLNIDFEYIYPSDKKAFENFVRKINTRLKELGTYTLSIALAPKISENQEGLLYESHDYEILGKETDQTIIMTYEWGYTYSAAMPVAPINAVTQVIDFAKTEIPSKKIFLGIPNYGYDFLTPHQEGKAAKAITNNKAIEYASSKNAAIQFDEKAKTPFFSYYNGNQRHLVYFEDPRSIKAKCLLAYNYHLGGLSIWTISSYWHQLYVVIETYFNIEKVI